MHVLQVVEDQHRKEAHLLWNHDEKQRLLPVQPKAETYEGHQHDVLGDAEPEGPALAAPQPLEVVMDRPLLVITADGGVAEQGQQVVALGVAERKGVIAIPVVELVVIHVMRWDPAEDREAVEDRQPVVGQTVEGL